MVSLKGQEYRTAFSLYSKDGKRTADVLEFRGGQSFLLEKEWVEGNSFRERHGGSLVGPFSSTAEAETFIVATEWFNGRDSMSPPPDVKHHLAVFDQLREARAATFLSTHGLLIKTDAAILRLQKPSWTTDDSGQLLNSNGLFFGVWIDAACEAKGIARYNVHAKKLRVIKGEAFAARDFARTFRAQAQGDLREWPNCVFPKGPITLFEGSFRFEAGTLKEETSTLMDRFAALTPLVDRLLAV